jgi:hypothetical protein
MTHVLTIMDEPDEILDTNDVRFAVPTETAGVWKGPCVSLWVVDWLELDRPTKISVTIERAE